MSCTRGEHKLSTMRTTFARRAQLSKTAVIPGIEESAAGGRRTPLTREAPTSNPAARCMAGTDLPHAAGNAPLLVLSPLTTMLARSRCSRMPRAWYRASKAGVATAVDTRRRAQARPPPSDHERCLRQFDSG